MRSGSLNDSRRTDVLQKLASTVRRDNAPDEHGKDGWNDAGTADQEWDFVLLWRDPDEGKIEYREEDERCEVSCGHGPIRKWRVQVSERRPHRCQQHTQALTAPEHLCRKPDTSKEESLGDHENVAFGAPTCALNDRKPYVPLCAGRTTEHAHDADDDVSDDDGDHALPNVEAEGDERRASGPAADVKRS